MKWLDAHDGKNLTPTSIFAFAEMGINIIQSLNMADTIHNYIIKNKIFDSEMLSAYISTHLQLEQLMERIMESPSLSYATFGTPYYYPSKN